MVNHPNRSKAKRHSSASPTPAEIRAAREAAGLTQTDAAELIYSTLSAWQRWEQAERAMHPALWELFRIKTGTLSIDAINTTQG